MKGLALFCVVLLIVHPVLCSQMSSQQGSLVGEEGKHILRKTNLGRALLQMVHMYSFSQTEGKTSSIDTLFDALDRLKSSLIEKLDYENNDFQSDSKVHDENEQRIQQLIELYSDQVITFTKELVDLKRQKQNYEENLKNLNDQLDSATRDRDSEIKFVQALEEKFRQDDQEYADALQLLDQAVEKLSEARDNSELAFQSFLEKNQPHFQKISILLETQVSKMRATKNSLTQPILKVFSQLQSGQQLSTETIQNAIDALIDLKNYLFQGRITNVQFFTTTKQSHNDIIQKLSDTIELLKKDLIPKAQSLLDLVIDQIQAKQQLLEAAQINLEQQKTELENERKSWTLRVSQHEILFNQLNLELEIVKQADDILRNAYNKRAQATATL